METVQNYLLSFLSVCLKYFLKTVYKSLKFHFEVF